MPGFTTLDSVLNAWSVNAKGQRLLFNKTQASVSVANIPHTWWTATGMPSAGGYGSLGRANGRVVTSATAGAFPYADPTSPATTHLSSLGVATLTANALGSLILVDRVSDVLVAPMETTGAVTGLDATSRLAATTGAGDGCQIWCEVQTAFSAAAHTFSLTYTNQVGTTGKVTPTISGVASAVVGRSINTGLWQPLATGDTGVRSVQTFTFGSGLTTGQFAICLVRPLAVIPIPAITQYIERDFVVELPSMPRIYDDACLSFIYVPTAAVTAASFGEIRIVEN